MEFLRSFLRRHLAGKPVVASRNVGFFFFSLPNLKNNFDTQFEYVDLRDSVKQARNTWQKSKFGIEQHHLCFRFRQ